ncbi:chemokine XC receptor 1-like [Pygocentrus nattereri]|uniref:Chemokine (C motif) receptor 1a, duplicate 1 n=1 Tax=Pygocentrus nattereri TaxID=42514 RepID=A0AAR2LJG3_PYGNA|nr:chemokine XC receptor 1-like [Pygocentrus nattereri]XP_037396898.1 chemokine XC receptor 1-like [Pygocentrus nattereri]XP_037396899.1 chemokine XC receptor 1-like [Pygocentrus nattereri]
MENSEEGENANSTFEYYYYYDSDDSPYLLCQNEALIKAVSTDFPIVLTIVVLLSLIGNVLVLVMFGLFENLKSLTNIFILNLALSDLIFTLGLPFWACYLMWSWTFGDFMCKSVNFIFSAGFHSSIVFLMLMSIERYVAVAHPRSDWNRWQRFVFPVIAWVFSFAAASPELLYSEDTPDPKDFTLQNITDFTKHYCTHYSTEAIFGVTYQQNILFVVAFSVMGFCYIRIILTIPKSQRNNRNRTRRLIFSIVVLFFICWAPYNIVMFLKTCDVFIQIDSAFVVCQLLAFSHCCFNPVLYVFVDVKFRNNLKMLLQKMFVRCRLSSTVYSITF